MQNPCQRFSNRAGGPRRGPGSGRRARAPGTGAGTHGHVGLPTPCPPRQHGPIWVQRDIRLQPRPRGFHLVTHEVEDGVPELERIAVGMAHLFVQHTSASLTLNENASPDVLRDFGSWFDDVVPEDAPFWTHTLEGPDDMPAHIKASLTGSSLTLPVSDGQLALGTWQGIYLCEHRDSGGSRSLVVTLWGEER